MTFPALPARVSLCNPSAPRGSEARSLRHPDHGELSDFLVRKQKLVDLKRFVRRTVLIFDELRLIVSEGQPRVGVGGQSLVPLSLDDDVQLLTEEQRGLQHHAR